MSKGSRLLRAAQVKRLGRTSMNWYEAEGKVKMLSTTGDKGKGHKCVETYM